MFRIGGIASGMDTESIVKQLMQVERMPLDRFFQRKQTIEWQRDAYREMNLKLKSLEEAAYSLRLTSAFNTREANTESSAFKASASATVQNGTYEFKVEQVATKTRNISDKISQGTKVSTRESLNSQYQSLLGDIAVEDDMNHYHGSKFSIATYDAQGNRHEEVFTVDTTKSLDELLKDINSREKLGIKAYYDSAYDKIVFERKDTGKFGPAGENEIIFNEHPDVAGQPDFLKDVLKIEQANEVSGTDAKVVFKNPVFGDGPDALIEQVSKSNRITIGGITFDVTETTADFEKVTVSSNTDQAFENIKAFVDKYNEVIAEIQVALNEPKFRDFPPLTDEQRRELPEREAELWDEKAKSGLLRRDPILSSVLSEMRMQLYSPVETTGRYNQIAQIGITTTNIFRDGGRLEIDETKLRQALEDDPDSVFQLFNNVADQALTSKDKDTLTSEERRQMNNQTGLVGRLRSTINNTMNKIVDRAGNEFRTNQQFTLGKELDDISKRMDNFQRRLSDIENRYWAQFSRMEQLMNQANAQATSLMAFLGGGAQ